MAKVTKISKNNDRIIIGYYTNEDMKKLVASIIIKNSGRYYEVETDTYATKQNYGQSMSGDDYYEVLYHITKFAAKNNLPYTDVEALKIWELRDAHMAKAGE